MEKMFFYCINLCCRNFLIHVTFAGVHLYRSGSNTSKDIKEGGGQRHLRAVFVCGMIVKGRNYLFIFGLGSIVTHRVHKLQRKERNGSDVI